MEVGTKNILYWFIKGRTHFGMARGASMNSALNELNRFFILHSNTTSVHAPQLGRRH